MKLSTRARYGVRAMIELGRHHGGGPLLMNVISRNQDISVKYLHALLTVLKTSGLIRSVHGSKGGFLLARAPRDIRLYDIVVALEGDIAVVACTSDDSACERSGDCAARSAWCRINDAIISILKQTTLDSMLGGEGHARAGASSFTDGARDHNALSEKGRNRGSRKKT